VASLGNGSGPTVADLRAGLVALFAYGDQHGARPDLSVLVGSLQTRNRGNSRVVDALLLIGDMLAEQG
jgi:hypothetical protein